LDIGSGIFSDGVETFFRDRDIFQDTGVKTRDEPIY